MSRLATRDLAVAALFTAVLAASAFITIPVGAVPFTLQIYVVLLAGMVLGPRLGALSVVAYLVVGLIAPVYSGAASGLGALLGPTGGYLLGFVPGVIVAGLAAGARKRSVARLTAAGLAGLLPIYLLGTAWLAQQQSLTLWAAAAAGVAPFVWIDALKALAGALTAKALLSLPLDLPFAARRVR